MAHMTLTKDNKQFDRQKTEEFAICTILIDSLAEIL